MKKNKKFIVVYEIIKSEFEENEIPIIIGETMKEVKETFENKWKIKTSRQALNNSATRGDIFQQKYKIFKIDLKDE